MGNACEGYRAQVREVSQIYWTETLVAEQGLGEAWLYARPLMAQIQGKSLFGVYETNVDPNTRQRG
jgi:hypothetical protein